MSSSKVFVCGVCEVTFTRKYDLKKHQMRQGHVGVPSAGVSDARGVKRMAPITSGLPAKRPRVDEIRRCDVCEIDVPKQVFAAHLRSNSHKKASARAINGDDAVQVVESAFKSRIVTYRLKNIYTAPDFHTLLKTNKARFIRLVEDKLKIHADAKINLELFGIYTKMSASQGVDDVKSFNTKNAVVTLSSDLGEVYDAFCEKMMAKSDEFQDRESSWSIKEVLYLEVNINKYSPLRGSSYIDLPKWICDKKAVINIQNDDDDACFAWSVMAYLHPVNNDKNVSRVSSYPHYSTMLDLTGIQFSVSVKDLTKFEEQNNISVNVFGVEGKSIIGPLHFSSKKSANHVNLLYVQDGERNHYCWIKNLSRLVGLQISRDKASKWICDGCLLFFRSEEQLRKHQEHDCNHISTTMPTTKDNVLEFKNIHKQLRVPFTIYADFESVLKPISTVAPDNTSPFTSNVQEHIPFSFAYYIKCSFDDSLNKFELYRGSDAAKVFMQKLKQEARRLGEILKTNVSMRPLTPLEEMSFHAATACGICKKPLGEERVHDHCHLTGSYRSAAHSDCNIRYKVPSFIPVVFHNLSGYDSHFIVKELACDKESVTIVPNNKERYISFTKNVRLADEDLDMQITLKI